MKKGICFVRGLDNNTEYYRDETEKRIMENISFPLIELYVYDIILNGRDEIGDIQEVKERIRKDDRIYQFFKQKFNEQKQYISQDHLVDIQWLFNDILKKNKNCKKNTESSKKFHERYKYRNTNTN